MYPKIKLVINIATPTSFVLKKSKLVGHLESIGMNLDVAQIRIQKTALLGTPGGRLRI